MDQTELDILKGSEEIMNKEQMNKYSYELMVKNNSDEAIKNLLLKDKEIERLLEENKDLTRMCEIYSKSLYNADLKKAEDRLEKAINIISLIRMDRDTSIETHKALAEILNVLRGSDK